MNEKLKLNKIDQPEDESNSLINKKEIKDSKSHTHFISLSNCEKGDINEIWNSAYPEENFVEFKVNEGNSKISLHTYRNATCTSPKGLVVYFHGHGSFCQESAYLALQLAKENYITVGYDHRGMGKSQGNRLYYHSVEQLIEDSLEFIKLVRELYPDLPVFIGGASLGGLISYRISHRSPNEFKGVFLLGPALRTLENCCSLFFVNCLGSCLPNVKVLTGDITDLTKNKVSIENYLNNPILNNEKTPLRSVKALLNGMKGNENGFAEYSADFIMFIGANDKMVDPNVGFALVNLAKSNRKLLYFYDEMYHDILNEIEAFDVIPKLIEWVNSVLEGK